MGNKADTAIVVNYVNNVVFCKSAAFEVIWYTWWRHEHMSMSPMSLGLCYYILVQNVRFHIQTYSLHWQVCENPIWLPDFCIPTYIYRVCIFKAFVTNTFGIDSDVLCFKLKNRTDLKMKKPQKPEYNSVPICYQNITSFFHNHRDYIDYISWIFHLLSKGSIQSTGEKSGHSAGITRAEEAKVTSN